MNNTQRVLCAFGLLALSACRPAKVSTVKEAWNEANNPIIMMAVKNEFETDFTKLPLSGRPEKMPWSDHYWPTYHGGITYRWGDAKTKVLNKAVKASSDQQFAGQLDNNIELQKLRSEVLGYMTYTKEQLAAMPADERAKLIATLSPAEKLDIYRGAFDYPTVKSERKRTDILATLRSLPSGVEGTFSPNDDYVEGKKIPTWYGICHAWAPATILFHEPGPLTLQSKDGFEVAMAGSDIKALLSHVIDADSSQQRSKPFLAERCNNDMSETAQGELVENFNALKLGSLASINTQVDALTKLGKFDSSTVLVLASFYLNYANSQEEAKLGFQKIFERMQNRLAAGSSNRKKLAIAYADSMKNFAAAGTFDASQVDGLRAQVLEAINIPACNDTNAGSFHLVISNMMGIQKKSFGVDVTRDTEVWNQAAASYSSKVLSTFQGAELSPKAAPGTVKELLIETVFLYTTEESPAWDRFGDDQNLKRYHVPAGDIYTANGKRYRALRYRIELNKENRIIGGSWISDSRPDFIWGTGNFIWSKEFSDIEDIYYQAI